MAIEDAIRWNQRYKDPKSWMHCPRKLLTENLYLIPQKGAALDIAMGVGVNASALLEHGLQVVGIDISHRAARVAKNNYPELQAVVADLTHFNFPLQYFDVICNFYYLQRELWPRFTKILKPRGYLFFETLTRPMTKIKPELDPHYLLGEGELMEGFKDWEIISYFEGWQESEIGNPKAVARLLARLPENFYSH